jgi:hypothetical protein
MISIGIHRLKRAVVVGSVALMSCFALPGQADTLGTIGYAKGSQSFDLSVGGNVNAGGFSGTWNSGAIIFWCIELTQYFGFGGSYSDYVASKPDNPTFTLLGQLFNEAYGQATIDAMHSAAFQLAIWEIVYDPDLDLGAGSFKVISGNAQTVALAQSWLDALGNFKDTYDLVFLHSATHQDFVTFGRPFNVPEPGSAALLVVALVAIAMTAGVRTRRGR